VLINLDANATHSLLPEVRRALSGLPEECLNPSSIHRGGQKARSLIEEARQEIRLFCGAGVRDKVVFTSGATEANNLAINSPFWRKDWNTGDFVVTTAIEHPSVAAPIERLHSLGLERKIVFPTTDGRFKSDFFWGESPARLCSIIYAGNETGDVLPVREIVKALRSHHPKTLIHVDAVQALGKLSLNFSELGADTLSISGHKIGGLFGSGALIVREGLELSALILGGAQEEGFRSGTENLQGIFSFGIAARSARLELDRRILRMKNYQGLALRVLAAAAPFRQNCWSREQLPNTLNLYFPGVAAEDLVVAADLEGVCISAGPACSAGKPEISRTLLAMGLPENEVRESVRISFESFYQPERLERGLEKLVECIARIRRRTK
jgi:cysteine desulfurase